jgi:hypothetical protein
MLFIHSEVVFLLHVFSLRYFKVKELADIFHIIPYVIGDGVLVLLYLHLDLDCNFGVQH